MYEDTKVLPRTMPNHAYRYLQCSDVQWSGLSGCLVLCQDLMCLTDWSSTKEIIKEYQRATLYFETQP